MKAVEFLTEAPLTASELTKHGGTYLNNLKAKIAAGQELSVYGKYQSQLGKTVTLDPESVQVLDRAFYPKGDASNAKISASNRLIMPDPKARVVLKTQDGKFIPLGALEKTPDIKGKEEDYNIGDIGEIGIALAVFSKFENQGGEITLRDFYETAVKTVIGMSEKGNSGSASMNSSVQWPTGKRDTLKFSALLPRRSMNYFEKIIKGQLQQPDPKITATLQGAIQYANSNDKVIKGIQFIQNNKESNLVRVTCDGISDQKGSKADIIMNIDGTPINIVSAKVGRSQLGQASGHDFQKQILFFNTVFGIDVSQFATKWGTTLQQHDAVLDKIWKTVTPKITAALAGDVTTREMAVVRQLADGLIKYSNTATPGDVDIVKLISNPGSPGYKLLRVDNSLHDALDKVDLIAKPGNKGVAIYGVYQGKQILLMKARSYLSEVGKTVRTIIEGGDLLDILAEIQTKSPK